MRKINVKEINVSVILKNGEEFISLTDIARYKNKTHPKDIVKNWLRNKNSIEFLSLWENINNPTFKGVEFDPFYSQLGSNSFVLSPKRWIADTNAYGMISRSGINGGTFAHRDIAFEFASWISPEFKLYLIREFQRLKEEESEKKSLEWSVSRMLAKINYRVHTDSIKENLVPKRVTGRQKIVIYASEADLLNVALFGMTAKQWRDTNKEKKGNIRDHVGIIQLICLSNLESINAELIRDGLQQSERLEKLNAIAIVQMRSLVKTAEKATSFGRLDSPK